MIKKFLKGQKGINLISLTVAVLVILVLTNVIIFNVRDNLKIEKLKSLQTDVANLRDKVSNYYAKFGTIPIVDIEYKNVDKIKAAGLISEVNDSGRFYVIDLDKIENLTLNYGRDYDKITATSTDTEINSYTDIYIINSASHNIFYVKGVKVDDDWYYTDYLAEDIDIAPINLRYIDNVKIPSGFYYVDGKKDTGIIISDVEGDDIDNSKKGNQYVWVPVENFDEFVRKDYGRQNIADANFVSTGKTASKYYEAVGNGISARDEVEQIYRSVKQNKGFFISRFEAGRATNGQVVSKKGEAIYNSIKWGNADETGGAVALARNVYPKDSENEVASTLCYGVQWDAIMNWISKDNNLSKYLTDSSQIGNYSNSGSPAKTGANDNYQTKNIYDLAGNVGEWTMENYNLNNYVIRGGDFSKTDSNYKTLASRAGGTLDYTNANTGFRIALYLKTPGINVGDYINYEPDATSQTIYSKDNLVEDITGSASNTTDISRDTLKWQVLKIHDDGSMDLIGSPTSQEIHFSDATGYNNGVYVMHDICEKLYSRNGIKARSVTLDDMENWLTDAGKVAKSKNISDQVSGLSANDYIEKVNKDNNTVTYKKLYSYYPNLYAKENGSGINTETVKTDGIKDANKAELDRTTRSTIEKSYKQVDNLTTTQTYYYIPINSTNCGDGSKSLYNGSNTYWVASRCVNCNSNNASFGLRHANTYVNVSYMFDSRSANNNHKYRLRPVVSLGPNVQVTASSTASEETGIPHTINQY